MRRDVENVERDVWIDFNNVDDAGWVTTLAKFATPGAVLKIGDRVIVGDDEGNTAEGEVLANDGRVLRIALGCGSPNDHSDARQRELV